MSHRRGTKYKVKRTYKDEFVPLTMPFISRTDWKAVPPSAADPPLHHPIPHIVLSYIEMGDISFEGAVLQMQRRDMVENKMPDIQCNFVVTGNGAVYEARGWDTQPGKTHYYPGYEGKFIEVTILGDYTSDPARWSVMHLIKVGKDYKYLAKDVDFLTQDKRLKDLLPSGSAGMKSLSSF